MSDSGQEQNGVRHLFRPHLSNIELYSPVRAAQELADESGIAPADLVKLDGNENPYAPSQGVLEALARPQPYNRYPDPRQRELRACVALNAGFSMDWIVMGAGSDELIELILRLFVEPGERIVLPVPTFGMYRFSAEILGGEVVSIPRLEDSSLDATKILAAMGDPKTKILFLASPNNPTGNLVEIEAIKRFAETGKIVVVDEAYYEFANETASGLLAQYPNLIILRTFSKWAGLAGLRVGYAICHAEIAEALFAIKAPYSVSVAAEVAALASIEEREILMQGVRQLMQDGDELRAELDLIDILVCLPSRANFVLCKVLGGYAKILHTELRNEGISVRYFDTPLLRDDIRISFGTPREHSRLLDALNKIRKELP